MKHIILIESFTFYPDKGSLGITIASGEQVYGSYEGGVYMTARGYKIFVPWTNVAGIVSVPETTNTGEEK